jgi:glyoxylate reductase
MPSSLPEIFVTHRLPDETLELLEGQALVSFGTSTARLDRRALEEGVRHADALVPMLSVPVDAALLEQAERLKIVANYAVGFNNVDLQAAERLGIWVTNTPDVVTDATADMAMGLLLAAARQIPEGERQLRAGRFEGWTPTGLLGAHLTGRTLGILGMGRIGKAMARRARGFGLRILYADRGRLSPVEEETLAARQCTFEELLEQSDFLSLHCPLTGETRHLIDAKALAKMKPTAVLINTSRGPVIDEEALARALHKRALWGAGLDVYEKEPEVHPLLLTAPGLVLAPHLGTSTLATRMAMAEVAFRDVFLVLGGQVPEHPVNRPASPRCARS